MQSDSILRNVFVLIAVISAITAAVFSFQQGMEYFANQFFTISLISICAETIFTKQRKRDSTEISDLQNIIKEKDTNSRFDEQYRYFENEVKDLHTSMSANDKDLQHEIVMLRSEFDRNKKHTDTRIHDTDGKIKTLARDIDVHSMSPVDPDTSY